MGRMQSTEQEESLEEWKGEMVGMEEGNSAEARGWEEIAVV